MRRQPARSSLTTGQLPVCLAVALAAGCAADRPAVFDTAPLLVRVGVVEPHLLLTGTVEAVESVRISVPPIAQDSVTVKWMVADGAAVEAGDVVVELDASISAAEVENFRLDVVQGERELVRATAEAEASTIRATSAVATARLRLAAAELEAGVPAHIFAAIETERRRLALDRARSELAGAESVLEVERSRTQAEVEVARIELETARRRLARAESTVEQLTVRAPRDGLFILGENRWEGRKIQTGDTLWVGWALGSIPRLDRMQIRARLSDVDSGKVIVGAPATCTLDSHPDIHMIGRVTSVGAVAREPDYATRRRFFDLLIDLDSQRPELMRPGMSVRVSIAIGAAGPALIVPRAALDPVDQGARVSREDGSWLPVRIELCSATECSVAGALAAGERLLPCWKVQ